MNLYIRLIWTLLRCTFLPAISPADTLTIRRRVWPNDLDINLHMNNGRYLTIVDLSLLEFFARTGFIKAMIKHRWRPMAGGAIASFRRGLAPFQRYDLRFHWLCSDEKWNYLAYEFVANGQVTTAGVLKGGFVSADGLQDPTVAISLLGDQWGDSASEILNRELPVEIAAWRDADSGIYASAQSRIGSQ